MDVRYLEQLKDPEQLKALGALGLYALRNLAGQDRSLSGILDELESLMDARTLAFFGKGDMARVRRYEIAGLLNRWRSAQFAQMRDASLQPEVILDVDA